MRIIIAGSGLLGASVMQPLIDSGHEIVGLIQNGRATPLPKRRGFLLRSRFVPVSVNVTSLALRRRVPIIWIDKMTDEELAPARALDPDLVIACGFSIIFKQPLLDLPRVGCLNLHSSLLPKHRGPSPFAHAILANESDTGVTFHVMDEDIDTGDIVRQVACRLSPVDTGMTVYHKCCELANNHILDVVDDIEASGLSGAPQNVALATYDPRMTHEAAAIDWRDSAEYIERLIRAASAYYPAWFTHRGPLIRVTRATFDPRPVDAAPGTVLETKPYPVVATGLGRLIIHAAHTTRPVPWTWPSPWARLKSADML